MTNKSTDLICKVLKKADPSCRPDLYTPFTGIDLISFSLNIPYISIKGYESEDLMITLCRAGHLKWQYSEHDSLLLGQGDFSVHRLSHEDAEVFFPNQIYEGLIICINPSAVNNHPLPLLEDTGVTPDFILNKFCSDTICSMIAGNEETGRIFSLFSQQPDQFEHTCQQLMIIELMLYLCKESTAVHSVRSKLQPAQIETIHQIHDYLLNHMDTRITIDMLAHQFAINPTTLKQVFKEVYGSSLAAHIKEHRMELASHLLKESNLSMSEIAKAVGYDSQSKFTAAFKNYYHVLPSSFRKQI